MSALAAAPFSFASTVTWNLSNVKFSDAATASGSFDWNVDTNTLSNWNISVGAGVLSAFTYTPSNSSAGSYFQVAGYENELLFMMNGTTRQLRMTPLVALTNAGGTVPINLNTFGNGSGSVECFNCAPYREIVSGTLMTGTPEPGAMGLLGIGAAIVGLIARKRRTTTAC
ncbi:MAG: PEP-CTERM sorting domain-containing protein [Bryobacteraceae bacterium]